MSSGIDQQRSLLDFDASVAKFERSPRPQKSGSSQCAMASSSRLGEWAQAEPFGVNPIAGTERERTAFGDNPGDLIGRARELMQQTVTDELVDHPPLGQGEHRRGRISCR